MKFQCNQAIGRVLVLTMATLMVGCAAPQKPLYHWGVYQPTVYSHFKSAKSPEEQIQLMEKDIEEARAKGLELPPGFRAHLAMLYGQTGRSRLMAETLEAEKKQFPEGATFMDFLLKKLNPS